MSGVNGNKLFRKILSKVEEGSFEKAPTYRKGIAERMLASLKENSIETSAANDAMSFE